MTNKKVSEVHLGVVFRNSVFILRLHYDLIFTLHLLFTIRPLPLSFIFLLTSLFLLSSIGWGYKKVFEEYAQAIQQRYPQITIHGANYPASRQNQIIATVLSYAKWAGLLVVIFGEKLQLGQNLNIPPPDLYTWSQQNKVCRMTWWIIYYNHFLSLIMISVIPT